jgi:hypothetical protein
MIENFTILEQGLMNPITLLSPILAVIVAFQLSRPAAMAWFNR